MGTIQPIKDKRVIEMMGDYLREGNIRNYLIFKVGINLGLSLGTLLSLQVQDIIGKQELLDDKYHIEISETLQKEIEFFIGNRKEGYLFRSWGEKPMTRFQLYKILRDAAEAVGYEEPIGSSVLRKTFAYWAYTEKKVHLPLLSKYLKHHTIAHTVKYIDVEKNDLNNVYLNAICFLD